MKNKIVLVVGHKPIVSDKISSLLDEMDISIVENTNITFIKSHSYFMQSIEPPSEVYIDDYPTNKKGKGGKKNKRNWKY